MATKGKMVPTTDERPEASSVIKRDYAVSLLLLSPLALWAAYIIRDMGKGPSLVYLIIAIAGTVVALGFGLARIGKILSLVEKGERVEAEVKQVIVGKNRGRIHFHYTYDGKSFDGVQAFRAREQVKKIKKGLRVAIALDPDAPNNAIIPSIFLNVNPFLEPGGVRGHKSMG